MAIVKEVAVKPVKASEILPVENTGGLRWAVVCKDLIVALFGSKYWAERFIDNSQAVKLELREVEE